MKISISSFQGHGYDHNWCLSHVRGDLGLSAQIFSEESGRAMDVYTDQPGVQFYTANWLEAGERKTELSTMR